MSLVNIIVPCYNGAKYLDRFFVSLKNQTFKDFDVHFVDDGSTDNTKEVVSNKIEEFKQCGIELHYYYKENGGAASAINFAFRQNLDGKYLLIMDADDQITPDCLQEKVEFLNANPNYGAVSSYYEHVNNETGEFLDVEKSKGIKKNKIKTFKNILLARGVSYPGYLFDKDKLFSVLENKQIFESHGGQNWQLLLPVAYNFKIGLIKKPLYRYFVIQSSHSHIINKTKQDVEKRILLHEEILLNTLNRAKVKKCFYKYISKYKLEKLINLAYQFSDKAMMKDCFKQYVKCGLFNLKLFIKYLFVLMGIKK